MRNESFFFLRNVHKHGIEKHIWGQKGRREANVMGTLIVANASLELGDNVDSIFAQCVHADTFITTMSFITNVHL